MVLFKSISGQPGQSSLDSSCATSTSRSKEDEAPPHRPPLAAPQAMQLLRERTKEEFCKSNDVDNSDSD